MVCVILCLIVIFYVAGHAAGILDCLILGNTLLHEHGQGHKPGFKMIIQIPPDVK